MTAGDPGALLAMEMLPAALPVEVGANAALKVVLAPAAIVAGVARPLRLKPVPEAVAADIVTLAVPVFFSVMVCELLLPMTTLPKLTLDGVAVSWP